MLHNRRPAVSIGKMFFSRILLLSAALSTVGTLGFSLEAHSQIRVPKIPTRIKRPPLVITVPGTVPALPCLNCDNDGDGVSIADGDCDDFDPARYPGATEVCDAAGKDEDCDPETYGFRDDDGDGKISAACFQASSGRYGPDCDDSNPAIIPGAMTCIPNQSGVYTTFDGTALRNLSGTASIYACVGTVFRQLDCGPGLSCIAQPNGTGVCGVAPANLPVIPGERP